MLAAVKALSVGALFVAVSYTVPAGGAASILAGSCAMLCGGWGGWLAWTWYMQQDRA